MTKRMLVDATHPEEIRVAIVQENRLSDLDIETSSREQIKGNIYLARVSRVEPSLQAAFIDFGGGRQGFLSVNDIHPKYYPKSDKSERDEYLPQPLPEPTDDEEDDEESKTDPSAQPVTPEPPVQKVAVMADEVVADVTSKDGVSLVESDVVVVTSSSDEFAENDLEIDEDGTPLMDTFKRFPRRQRMPIQKILTRGQKLLVQVVKESRGNKGASLTTNLSLAGRYAVWLPQNAGGGGISRKITDTVERKKLKEILETISIPGQVSLIIRTAGLGRTKREIIRDLNYLLRLWKKILDNATTNEPPSLIHEEGDLIMRTIRDLYTTDMTEILIDGQEGYRRGKDFMRLLMPRYLKVVQPYKDSLPIFSRYQIENQIESMHERVIQLKAGGYLVIEPTEALVSIDINSGRSTREKDVESTAYKTNLQAADEIARQLRLRDLGGLVVIDFIDMEDKKHNLDVERQMREALKLDRAKIQLGKISTFGLLELSRQRMKPTFSETNRQECPRCKGLGTIRSVESAAIHLFRMLEEEISKNRYSRIAYYTSAEVANYLLNYKRSQLIALETENGVALLIHGDKNLQTPEFKVERVERVKVVTSPEEGGQMKTAVVTPKEPTRAKNEPPPKEVARQEPALVTPTPTADEAVQEDDAPVVPVVEEVVEKKKRRRRRRRKSSVVATIAVGRNFVGNEHADVDVEMPIGIKGVHSTSAPGLFVLSGADAQPDTMVDAQQSHLDDAPVIESLSEENPQAVELKPKPPARRRRRRKSPAQTARESGVTSPTVTQTVDGADLAAHPSPPPLQSIPTADQAGVQSVGEE